MSEGATVKVTEKQVQLLARLAALPLDPQRIPALTTALGADLRLIDSLRGIDVGDAVPMGPGLPHEHGGRHDV
ncbi:MAG: hypothetical protein M3Y74_00910 [Chloroflexota bacterium]|jgi:Asp-tRNA(Asn)/Glu-tRNA(Gln) amidotransferase C subunit|nr:hypothetical protein [Chloroflexota bacterium]